MKTHAFRLKQGADLRKSIEDYTIKNGIKAGVVLSGVGALTKVELRNAGATKVITLEEHFEIVSITGTLSQDESHIHISVADENLRTYGGHMKTGCIVGVTAEIVLLEMTDVEFRREVDDTDYECLAIHDLN
ncbi:MAG: PPC domain-containing DNA-binding protein [Candidatus Saccharimonadales bacterium]